MLYRDLKVPDVSGPHCMVVQYGPGGALCLTSKMVCLDNIIFMGGELTVLFIGNLGKTFHERQSKHSATVVKSNS